MSARREPTLTVTFHKVVDRSPMAWWEAIRPSRGRVRGGYMPIGRGRIPHDLGHMATEAHLGIRDGFGACWHGEPPSTTAPSNDEPAVDVS